MKNFWQDLPRPFFILAPMEAVTDIVFRHVVAAAGPPDVWFTEFTNATGWAHAGDKAIGGRLIKTDDENPIVAQLWGSDPTSMEKLAHHCVELGYSGIDINMGCPDSSAVKSGGGAGMILNPENAAAIIAAAKTSGLPVSVKTRLGYSKIDEWHDWIAHILSQDIVNFTIHLRTKKEMSKVPAHYELIADIKKLRDEIAPQTLLTINGDIRDRQHGIELVEQYGVDGVMIGRGIFANPFAFSKDLSMVHSTPLASSLIPMESSRSALATSLVDGSAPSSEEAGITSEAGVTPTIATRASDIAGEQEKSDDTPAADGEARGSSQNVSSPDGSILGADASTGPARSDLRADFAKSKSNDASGEGKEGNNRIELNNNTSHIQKRLDLLNLQLNLYDEYHTQTHRPFETLKRFFKIYIRDFAGASELRDKLMHTKSTDEVRALLAVEN